MKFQILLTPAFLIMLALSPTGQASAQDTPLAYAAREFWLEFEGELQKAEEEFIGKNVKITGVVVDAGMSVYLTPAVRLSDKIDGQTYVVCVLPRIDASKLAEFRKGDTVTLIGRVYSGRKSNAVVVKECRRVE